MNKVIPSHVNIVRLIDTVPVSSTVGIALLADFSHSLRVVSA